MVPQDVSITGKWLIVIIFQRAISIFCDIGRGEFPILVVYIFVKLKALSFFGISQRWESLIVRVILFTILLFFILISLLIFFLFFTFIFLFIFAILIFLILFLAFRWIFWRLRSFFLFSQFLFLSSIFRRAIFLLRFFLSLCFIYTSLGTDILACKRHLAVVIELSSLAGSLTRQFKF